MTETLFSLITVHCFFQRWCSHTEVGIDPDALHEAMESHDRQQHYGKHLQIVYQDANK